MSQQITFTDVENLIQVVFYLISIFGVIVALWTYRSNQQLERTKWVSALYDKFYEKPDLKGIRQALDCDANASDVAELVARANSNFTDYLNFFEHVVYLVKRRQISKADANAYFEYYFSCLQRHAVVRDYVKNKTHGYELLAEWFQ
jgi:predicted negative regulator of RcsB-dependent stress response